MTPIVSQDSLLTFKAGDFTKEVMRITADGIWVNPEITTSEAADEVIKALRTYIQDMVEKANAAPFGEADVWHEGSQSFYRAKLLVKISDDEMARQEEWLTGCPECGMPTCDCFDVDTGDRSAYEKEMVQLAAVAYAKTGAKWHINRSGLLADDARWDPLSCNHDAMCLAVSLHIEVTYPEGENVVRCWHRESNIDPIIELLGDDPEAAVCRAITRTAAEIAKSMA